MAKKAADLFTPNGPRVGTRSAVTFPALPPERKTIPLRQLVRAVAAFPLDKVVPLDDAFIQVKNSVGWDQLAALDLTKYARAGCVPVVARQLERGGIEQVFILRPCFWNYCKIVVANPFDASRPEGASVIRETYDEGPRLVGSWFFFVGRRRLDRLPTSARKPVAQQPSPTQSQPQSPKPTPSEPTKGLGRDVYAAMKNNRPRKGQRNYATSLWVKLFKKKGVPKKSVQNVVSLYRKELEVDAGDARDPQKPPKKSSRRK